MSSRLARLSEGRSCRASYAGADGERLCLDAALWERGLARGSVPSGCASWFGRWRSDERSLALEPSRSLLLKAVPGRIESPLVRVERVRETLSRRLEPADPLGLARKLLLDERAGGSAQGVLRRLGFVHVLTATGIHLYALSWVIALALRPLLAAAGLGPTQALWACRAVSLASWLFCWLMAGARLGFLRPLLLVGARRAAEASGIRWRLWAPLALALAADLAVGFYRGESPPGRLAYALAVAGGVASLDAFREGLKWGSLRAHLVLATGSWVFLGIVEAWEAGTLALATPLLSLVTIPVLSVCIYPLLLASALAEVAGVASLSEELARMGAELMTGFILRAGDLTMAVPTLWVVPHWALLAGAAVALGLAALGMLSSPRAGPALALALALGAGLVRAPGTAGVARAVAQLPVGQGDSALVLLADGTAGLIDAGSAAAVPDARWIELLALSGVSRLDWVALTHLDEDHAGGLEPLARLLPLGCVESPHAQWRSDRGYRLRRELGRAGIPARDWGSGCVPFPMLGPPEHRGRLRANEAMGAIWVPIIGGGSYLSAGDATAANEPRIGVWAVRLSRSWEQNQRAPPARILKVSHHGSKTSSDPRLLALFAPGEAWISLGRGNLYGHPHPSVLARLRRHGVHVRRTDLEGELRAGAGPHRR